jgi:hypothetical protein
VISRHFVMTGEGAQEKEERPKIAWRVARSISLSMRRLTQCMEHA